MKSGEKNHLLSENSIYIDESKFSHDKFCLNYWELWPKDVDNDLTRLNESIQKDNVIPKYSVFFRRCKASNIKFSTLPWKWMDDIVIELTFKIPYSCYLLNRNVRILQYCAQTQDAFASKCSKTLSQPGYGNKHNL